jgi:hypothetical protein
MTHKIVYSLITILGTASITSAAVTLNLAGSPSTGPQFVVGSGNTTFAMDGSLIRVGTFESVPSANATFTTLESAFREFGRTTIGHSNAAAPVNQGRVNRAGIAGIEGGTSPDADSFFIGKSVYIWVYNGASSDPMAAQGVFSTAQATFADAAAAVSLSVNLFLSAFGTHDPALNPTSTEVNGSNQVTFFHLSVPVPEPSAFAVTGLVALAAFMRRRR